MIWRCQDLICGVGAWLRFVPQASLHLHLIFLVQFFFVILTIVGFFLASAFFIRRVICRTCIHTHNAILFPFGAAYPLLPVSLEHHAERKSFCPEPRRSG